MNRPGFALAAVIAAHVGVAPAQTVAWPLNDTGVTSCSANGTGQATTDCIGSGQDAGLGRDVTQNDGADGVAGFSFVRLCNTGLRAGQGDCPAVPVIGPAATHWGCTLDTTTGLVWEIKRNDGGPRDRQRAHSNLSPDDPAYGSATDAASMLQALNAEALCGYTDWALPTRQQAMTLVHYGIGHPGPTIDIAYFEGTQNWLYWTSSAPAGDPARAVVIDDAVGVVHTALRTLLLPARAVRGGRPAPQPRFRPVAGHEDEVRDTATGLIWARCPHEQSWLAGACTGVATSTEWPAAIALASQLTGGWRMPNVKEMNSIVDEALPAPKLDPVAFPGAASVWQWKSTNYVDDEDYTWAVDLTTGRTFVVNKRNWDGLRQFRIVRDDPNPDVPDPVMRPRGP
jgi:hypothetical protein